jgi:tetratricopeptide (TPR) repeat protein
MQEEATRTIEVFYSYAQKDELLRKELEKHLSILRRQRLITNWHDGEITAGEVVKREIDAHLNTAQIILLLVSPDFLASDFCYESGVKQALKRHEAGKAYVIPVLLRPVDWKHPPLNELQALPMNEEPIVDWPNPDKAFLDVAIGIRKAVLKIRSQRPGGQNIGNHTQDSGGISASDDPSIALIETQKANTLYERNHYDKALENYTQAIRLDPEYPFAYRGKGETFQKLKRYNEALAAYDQALRLDPDDINTYRDKGALLYSLKRYEEALAIYEHILRLHAEDSGASYSKGVIYLRLAQQAFEKAQQLRKGIADNV